MSIKKDAEQRIGRFKKIGTKTRNSTMKYTRKL